MARVESTKVVEVKLTLDFKEAVYLRDLLCNYLGEGEEPVEHGVMRSELWNAISRGLKNA